MPPTRIAPPEIARVASNATAIAPHLLETPVVRYPWSDRGARFGCRELHLKLELLQATGSFKVRSALTTLASLDPSARDRGVVTVSSGNFAIACTHAANLFGARTTVFMSARADPYRVARARELGAEVRLVHDHVAAFEEARRLDRVGERTFVHPWDGPTATLGTASIALELDRQLPAHVDTFVVAIGGGSLISGLAPTIKSLRPGSRVIGVEPAGAATLHRSLQAGVPVCSAGTGTAADSLAAPFAEAYSFSLVQQFVDRILLVEDTDILEAMRLLFRDFRLAVEPAAVTALAGVQRFPEHFRGAVCVIVCGSNIGMDRYLGLLGGIPGDDPGPVR